LGITQEALAKQLNVCVETIQNWEHSRSIPAICYLAKLIGFLGYDPFENSNEECEKKDGKSRPSTGLRQKQY